MTPDRDPILVTGLPRSGTTWLARLLALSPGACLTGREPMNPRGRQFALAGSVAGWTRLDTPTDRQHRTLRRVYAGREPRTYSRYGVRQWAGPAPWSRVVVKDPFALLSIPAIVHATGALPVVVYRHPGAVLASYRRMGWRADLAEVTRVLGGVPEQARAETADEVTAMAWFWRLCHERVLRDAAHGPAIVLADHAELASGGRAAVRRVYRRCGLRWGARVDHEVRAWVARSSDRDGTVLHDFDRAPRSVAQAWRSHLHPGEEDRLEAIAGSVYEQLRERRLRLGPVW